MNAVLSVYDGRATTTPSISVIIVAYRSGWALVNCLGALAIQPPCSFEIIVVDNGGNDAVMHQVVTFPVLLLRCRINQGPSHARNVGLGYARAPIVCFLDDDALPDGRFLDAHLTAHGVVDVLGVRGRIVPRTPSIFNALARGYDLGPRMIAAAIDVEGNSSWKRASLLMAGGFNEHIFGHEGAELSLRIVRMVRDPWCLRYTPDAVIYHDYSDGVTAYLEKTVRHAATWARLSFDLPVLYDFMRLYLPLRPAYHRQGRGGIMGATLGILEWVTGLVAGATHKVVTMRLRMERATK
ncbi:MAG: hypothetical protein NVS2B7_34960 [Herpetosiphon sp.]